MSDILTQIASKAKQAASQNNKSYSSNFLVNAQKVDPHPQEPGVFRVTGFQVNELGQRLDRNVLVMISPTDNQNVPKAGELLEVQKGRFESNLTSKKGAPFELYTAQYYQSFGSSMAMACEALPYPPQKRQLNSGGVAWSANFFGVDSEAASTMSAAALLSDQIDMEVAQMLQPWNWPEDKRTTVTHDVLGKAVHDGSPRYGMSPSVVIRVGGEDIRIFGVPAIMDKSTGEIRRPTQDEIIERLQKNNHLTNLKAAMRESGVTPEMLQEHKIHLLPAVSAQIGKSALAGESEGYLLFPDRFAIPGGEDGKTTRGYQHSLFRVKVGPKNNYLVDQAKAYPRNGSWLGAAMEKPSPTPYERQQMEGAQQQAAQQQAPAPQQQQPQQQAAQPAPQQPAPQQPAPAPQQQVPEHLQEQVPTAEYANVPMPDEESLGLLDSLNFDVMDSQQQTTEQLEQAEQAAKVAALARARASSGPRM